MAGLNEIKLKIDSYFVESRLYICSNLDCRFNNYEQSIANCMLKKIGLDNEGKCVECEIKKEEKEKA